MKQKNVINKMLKQIADKQINDAVNGRCIFLCYQPDLPKSLKIMKKEKSKI